MKEQTDIAKNNIRDQTKLLNLIKKTDETKSKDNKKPTLQKYNKSDQYMMVNGYYKYQDIKNLDNLSLKSKYSFLVNFFNDLDKSSRKKKEKSKWI